MVIELLIGSGLSFGEVNFPYPFLDLVAIAMLMTFQPLVEVESTVVEIMRVSLVLQAHVVVICCPFLVIDLLHL